MPVLATMREREARGIAEAAGRAVDHLGHHGELVCQTGVTAGIERKGEFAAKSNHRPDPIPKRRADDDFPLIIVHDGRGLVELGWVYRDGLRFVAIVIGRELARYDTIDAATAAIFAATRKGRARTEEGAAD